MSKQRVAGYRRHGRTGRGDLTKMVDAGYRVVVTYSPGNNRHEAWLARMEGDGYDFVAVPFDVADYDVVRAGGGGGAGNGSAPSTCWSTTPASRAT